MQGYELSRPGKETTKTRKEKKKERERRKERSRRTAP